MQKPYDDILKTVGGDNFSVKRELQKTEMEMKAEKILIFL